MTAWGLLLRLSMWFPPWSHDEMPDLALRAVPELVSVDPAPSRLQRSGVRRLNERPRIRIGGRLDNAVSFFLGSQVEPE